MKITGANVKDLLTCASLLLVFNPHSKSTPIRLCADPSRTNKGGTSINDSILSGFSHLEPIQSNLLKSQFAITQVIGDIANFYLQSRLNIENSLNSAIYLQKPTAGSNYPTLDPRIDTELQIYLFISAKFGWVDAGALANLIKSRLADIYKNI